LSLVDFGLMHKIITVPEKVSYGLHFHQAMMTTDEAHDMSKGN